jgi:hypothetical protein
MFQVVYLKHCKEFCCSCEVGPSVIVQTQNTCRNRAVQGVVVSWLLVTFLGLHSMALYWLLRSFSWSPQQYTLAVPKHFANRFAYIEFFRSRGPVMFPLPSCTFCLREVIVNPRLVASENAFEEIMTMNCILLVEWVLTILCTLWSSDSVFGTPRARTWWKPN